MKLITKYQQGGPVATGQGTPAQGGAEDQLAMLAQQLVETLMQSLGDPNAVIAVLQAALEMVQGAAQEQAQPVFKKGGKLVKKSQKACGGKMK